MRYTLHAIAGIMALLLFSACGSSRDATPAIATTQIPDPCNEANLPAEVEKIHDLMREFDDYAALASNTPQTQLVQVIPEMQRVLREAENQEVPACLADMKALQLAYMNTVVRTLIAFLGNSDVNLVNEGIKTARGLHTQYDIEMARLLGLTLTVITITPPHVIETAVTPQAQVTHPPTPEPLVTNNGANDLNLRIAPDFNAAPTNVLAVGQSTAAIGRTTDSLWILVQVPGQPDKTAWVYASVVQLSVPIEALPIAPP